MSPKVISLAARRRERLDIQWRDHLDAPVNRERYDAWVEVDGSLMLRVGAEFVQHQQRSTTYGPDDGPPVFAARGDAYEMRVPAEVAAQWFKDMERLGICSRRTTETRRGVYTWQFTPRGDGTFTAKHAHRTGILEPFRPKLRNREILTGKVVEGLTGKVPELDIAKRAPLCEVCNRVIQPGETAYRERRDPSGRTWPTAVICSTCIQRAPAAGIREAGGAR